MRSGRLIAVPGNHDRLGDDIGGALVAWRVNDQVTVATRATLAPLFQEQIVGARELALVLEAVRAAGNEIREIRATGGFLRDPFTRQLFTDVVGNEIRFAAATEGSAFGAAGQRCMAGSVVVTVGDAPLWRSKITPPEV